MGEVVKLEPRLLFSINEFCKEAKFDNATIARRLHAARIKPAGKKKKLQLYRLADLLKVAYLTDDDGAFNPAGLDPFKRKAHYQAMQEEVRYRNECGELIPKIEVERSYAAAIKVHARFCDMLPDMLERDCGLTPAQIAAVEARIDKARVEFVKELVKSDEAANKEDKVA